MWIELEKDFRALNDPFNYLSAEYDEPSPDPKGYTGWRLTGPTEEKARFEAIARRAGKALSEDQSIRHALPWEVILQADHLDRWLTAVRMKTDGYIHEGPYP
jgi:hypothetical protein